VQPDGSVRNTYIKSIQNETGGQKRVLIRVTSPTSGLYTELPISVTLIANTVATVGTIQIFDQSGNPKVAGDSVPVGTRLDYRATVLDPQGDLVNYKWILHPAGHGRADNFALVGAGCSPGYCAVPERVPGHRHRGGL
jgi:hypothetical protein